MEFRNTSIKKLENNIKLVKKIKCTLNIETKLNLIKKYLIKTVLKSFNHTAVKTEMKGFGVVVNKQNKLIGVITEGDIRRILIKGASVNDSNRKLHKL